MDPLKFDQELSVCNWETDVAGCSSASTSISATSTSTSTSTTDAGNCQQLCVGVDDGEYAGERNHQ